MKIIGLTGFPLSGKDTVAQYLVTKSFKMLSAGDIIRTAMRAEGLRLDRASIQAYVTRQRALRGDAYVDEEMLPHITGNTVISAFREMAGVDFFRKKFPGDFILLEVAAPIELRYARAQMRQREGDIISLDEFKAQETYELSAPGYSMQQVLDAADARIENSGSEVDLFKQLDIILEKYGI